MKLKINELFYSLQGEGGRMGEASVFIRLAGCNLRCDFCDTDFEQREELEPEEIFNRICGYPGRWIIWTGGEPALQLTDGILLFFKGKGYRQAIESNGCYPLSPLLDYTVCSPKGNPDYAKAQNPQVDEVRIPVKSGGKIPHITQLPKALYYFLSPVFDADEQATKDNIAYCVEQILANPAWKLSVQMHKLVGIK